MDTQTPTPAATLAGLLAARAVDVPEAPALIVGDRPANYAALAYKTARRAAALAAECLPPTTLIAFAGPTADIARTLLACSWAGRAFLPLDAAADTPTWAGVRRLMLPPPATGFPLAPAAERTDTPALAVATSGSEGERKIALLAGDALAAAAAASAARLPLAPGDVWLDCLPLHHIGGLSIFWRCFAAGAAVRLHDGFVADAVWGDIAAGRTSHVSLVPAMLSRLLDVAGDTPPPASLRCALIGGAALSRPLWLRARAAGWPIHVCYGMTETAAQVALLEPTDDWHEGLVGKPLPGVELAVDEDGRLRIRTPQRMLGYLGETERPFTDGWLRTGDLARLDDEGRLHIIGRGDDMLVSGGVNVHPIDVEQRLAACPGVSDIAVTATPDPVWGDRVTALFVGAVDPAAVESWTRDHVPAALRPRCFFRVETLPRNAMGKLERRRLGALLAESAP